MVVIPSDGHGGCPARLEFPFREVPLDHQLDLAGLEVRAVVVVVAVAVLVGRRLAFGFVLKIKIEISLTDKKH